MVLLVCFIPNLGSVLGTILTFDWSLWPRYQHQLVEHAKKCEEREGELVREGVARDLRLQSLQDARDKLQADLQRKEEDMKQ